MTKLSAHRWLPSRCTPLLFPEVESPTLLTQVLVRSVASRASTLGVGRAHPTHWDPALAPLPPQMQDPS